MNEPTSTAMLTDLQGDLSRMRTINQKLKREVESLKKQLRLAQDLNNQYQEAFEKFQISLEESSHDD